jgi:hypothetical protein
MAAVMRLKLSVPSLMRDVGGMIDGGAKVPIFPDPAIRRNSRCPPGRALMASYLDARNDFTKATHTE